MSMPFDPADHYWIVAEETGQLWSSASAAYVAADAPTYLDWLAAGGIATRIASEAELDAVLVAGGRGDRAPNPPRRAVLKSVIIARLIAAEKIAAAKATLESDAALYARWWAPDRPAIHHDDADALALLGAIGADPATIMAP
jgi:hypothetical protein